MDLNNKIEEKSKEVFDKKSLITKVDNRVKTKVFLSKLGCNKYKRTKL